MPAREYGSTAMRIISQRVAPSASAPSLSCGGTVVMTSREIAETIGRIMIAMIKPATAKLVKSWLDYALGDGQKVAPELQYAPLPDAIKQKAQAKVDGLQCNGSAIGA